MYSQLVWEQPNTGVSATISVGEFSVWNMVSPTLNGQEMPVGALIGVFYELDGELYCGGYSTWGVGASFESSGMIAISSQGDDSTTPEQDGFLTDESYNWFAYYDGVDYYASNATMVEPNGQLTGSTYTTNALSGLASADFVEWTGEEEPELSCECDYFTAIQSGAMCIILNGCDDPLASNYCPGLGSELTIYTEPASGISTCEYADAVEGCTCSEAINYDSSAQVDDGSCYVIEGGCSDPLAANYSGDACATATFVAENCLVAGCMCPDSYNYDATATADDGSCVVISGGCSDASANNYSGDACATAIFASEDCQYTPEDVDLTWEYTITDGNMTIQIGAEDVVAFNGVTPPEGSLIGAFFINNQGEYQCGGYLEWTGDQLALAVWASESGFDNGFESGEEIIWGLSIGDQDFIATSSEMNTSPPFTPTFITNGFGQLLSAEFEGELTSILGCTDSTAFNYNSDATVDDGSCYELDWNVTNTDCNMTILINESSILSENITLNSEAIPNGAVIGIFYENADGQFVCAGSEVWTGTSVSVPAMGSESGFDNGFQVGEQLSTWALLIGNQTFTMDIDGAVMSNSMPWSDSWSCNGF